MRDRERPGPSENQATVMVAKEKGPFSATYYAGSNSYMTNCRNQTDMP